MRGKTTTCSFALPNLNTKYLASTFEPAIVSMSLESVVAMRTFFIDGHSGQRESVFIQRELKSKPHLFTLSQQMLKYMPVKIIFVRFELNAHSDAQKYNI